MDLIRNKYILIFINFFNLFNLFYILKKKINDIIFNLEIYLYKIYVLNNENY